MVHGNTAYFSKGSSVYSYTVSENKWTKLPQCKYRNIAITVVNDALTTIGGQDHQRENTNTLLSLSGSSWEEVLPPMPTKRMHSAATNISTHLVVAGGRQLNHECPMATVEILNTETLQWSTASSLPIATGYPQMATCSERIYLARDHNNAYSCSVEDLLKSTNSSDGGTVWARLASIPTPHRSSLATLRGRVLAIGGRDDCNPTGAIHCYDVATDSWSVIGEMPTPRSRALTAVLPNNELVVVGGKSSGRNLCATTEISSCSNTTYSDW